MRLLLVGDIHLADRPPSIRTDDYKDHILAKLWQTCELANHAEVEGVVWVGDVFHIKAASRTSHSLVQDIIEIGQSYECPWIIVPGNHDLTHDRMESLEKQPLGVIFRAGAIKGDGEIKIGDSSIYCVPWLKDFPEQLPGYMKGWKNSSAPLMVTHAPILPSGSTAPYEFYSALDWAHMMSREGHVFYGHIHDNHGIHHGRYTDDPDIYETHSSTFCNFGAISRGSLHEATLKRKPAVAYYTSDASEPFERQELRHLPAEEVFRLNIKQADDERKGQLANFLTSVEDTELEGLSIETVMAHIETLDLSDLTRQLIAECLEEAVSK